MTMLLASNSRRSVRKYLCWVAGLVAIVIVTFVALRLSRPTVVIGRDWPLAKRVACDMISHRPWDELLQRFVDDDGNVDYTAWKNSADDLRQLDEYLASLSRLDENRSASKLQRLAFWINAYNAVTVRGILREYPTSSIQNHVARVWSYNIWRDLKLVVGNAHYSLGEIEHQILRPLGEPRIHFAIVCASRGCPRLLNDAYTSELIEEQLQRNTLAFFADPSKCAADVKRHELRLSPILSWYAADFGSPTPILLQRIADWLPDDAQSLARSNDVRIVYLDYDWNLNDQTSATPPLPPPE
jgi:hypothetical protein